MKARVRWTEAELSSALSSALATARAAADRVAALVEEAAAWAAAAWRAACAGWLSSTERVIERIDKAAKAGEDAE